MPRGFYCQNDIIFPFKNIGKIKNAPSNMKWKVRLTLKNLIRSSSEQELLAICSSYGSITQFF